MYTYVLVISSDALAEFHPMLWIARTPPSSLLSLLLLLLFPQLKQPMAPGGSACAP